MQRKKKTKNELKLLVAFANTLSPALDIRVREITDIVMMKELAGQLTWNNFFFFFSFFLSCLMWRQRVTARVTEMAEKQIQMICLLCRQKCCYLLLLVLLLLLYFIYKLWSFEICLKVLCDLRSEVMKANYLELVLKMPVQLKWL